MTAAPKPLVSSSAVSTVEIPSKSQRDKFLTLAEIAALDGKLPALNYIIKGLEWEGSKNIYGGDSGTYKTWAQLAASMSIAAGQKVWDRFETRQTGVLYVLHEGIYRMVLQDVEKVRRGLGLGFDVPFFLWYRPTAGLTRPEEQDAFIDRIRLNGIGRVVLDPVALAFSVDEIDPDSWRRQVFNPLDRIIDETNVSILLSHHVNKDSLRNPGTSRKAAIRGHTAFPAWADAAFVASRSKGQALQLEHVKMRGAPDGLSYALNVAFTEDKDGKAVKVSCSDWQTKKDSDATKADLEQAVADALEAAGGPLTPNALTEILNSQHGDGYTSRYKTTVTLTALEKDGTVRKVRSGGQGGGDRFTLIPDDEEGTE